jgi:hypothetical protein
MLLLLLLLTLTPEIHDQTREKTSSSGWKKTSKKRKWPKCAMKYETFLGI